ncbi:MAG: hypothetical protein QOI44_1604 [Actinomycetota bacterium]|nr:hypothetical protein [Actinomycetota bacterium]
MPTVVLVDAGARVSAVVVVALRVGRLPTARLVVVVAGSTSRGAVGPGAAGSVAAAIGGEAVVGGACVAGVGLVVAVVVVVVVGIAADGATLGDARVPNANASMLPGLGSKSSTPTAL